MQTGKIRQISKYRGFGFIKSDTGGDVFFQRGDVKSVAFDPLKEGQSVEFEKGDSPKGPKAVNIKLIKKAN